MKCRNPTIPFGFFSHQHTTTFVRYPTIKPLFVRSPRTPPKKIKKSKHGRFCSNPRDSHQERPAPSHKKKKIKSLALALVCVYVESPSPTSPTLPSHSASPLLFSDHSTKPLAVLLSKTQTHTHTHTHTRFLVRREFLIIWHVSSPQVCEDWPLHQHNPILAPVSHRNLSKTKRNCSVSTVRSYTNGIFQFHASSDDSFRQHERIHNPMSWLVLVQSWFSWF